jgi:mannan endo-1,4-beta-mannosidase
MLFRLHPLCLGALILGAGHAQVTIQIDTEKGRQPISPWIYGQNHLAVNSGTYANMIQSGISSLRLGGNRMTGYNWEIDASNAGSDYIHSSDKWINGSPVNFPDGLAGTVFGLSDATKALGQMPTIQLPMAGYVVADALGAVATSEVAPSARWKKVLFKKPGTLSTTPDLTDNFVYMDEFVNAIVQSKGTAGAGNPRAYCLDNEPLLWKGTHPRIAPNTLNIPSFLDSSAALAKVIRETDPGAEIQGPEFYGFGPMLDFTNVATYTPYKAKYNWGVAAYLGEMKARSDLAGKKLLDVFTFHWYPENKGGGVRIVFGGDANITAAVAEARMQAPRSLWDSTYTQTQEDSWPSDVYNPQVILPRVQKSIDQYYPGTKIGITEYYYGGTSHISGGIAQADFYGIMGAHGVHVTNLHTDMKPYLVAATKLYRNYNGSGGTFGDISVKTTNPDRTGLSVWSSILSADSSMHIVAINKKSIVASVTFQIGGANNYASGSVFGFDEASSEIKELSAVQGLPGKSFTYSIPPLSVLHFVLKNSTPVPVRNWRHSIEDLSAKISGDKLQISCRPGSRVEVGLWEVDGNTSETLFSGISKTRAFELPLKATSTGITVVKVKIDGKIVLSKSIVR